MADNKRIKGSALISALFIMTLVAIGATAMSARLQLDIYRTRLILNSDALYLASEAVTFWAMDTISTTPSPELSQKLAKKNGVINYPKSLEHLYPDIITKGTLEDLQNRFNINNLQETEQQAFFYRLLKHLAPESKQAEAAKIVNATRDWITEPAGQAKNEYSTYYLQKKPAYQAPHQAMQSISEFRLVQGVDKGLYEALLPYITALPSKASINLNTASAPILMALGQGLDEQQAESIIQTRGENGFQNLNDAQELLTSLHIPVDQVTLESSYFLATAITSNKENQTLTHYVILKSYKDHQGQPKIQVVFDSLNAL